MTVDTSTEIKSRWNALMHALTHSLDQYSINQSINQSIRYRLNIALEAESTQLVATFFNSYVLQITRRPPQDKLRLCFYFTDLNRPHLHLNQILG